MTNNIEHLLAKHSELLALLVKEADADVRADINIKLAVLEEAIDDASE